MILQQKLEFELDFHENETKNFLYFTLWQNNAYFCIAHCQLLFYESPQYHDSSSLQLNL